ncbi:MAG: hypothetical protein V4436_03260 [Patescibacteria group bacterium]
MTDLASLGLTLHEPKMPISNEKRTEVRLASNGAFVTWFRSITRTSDGEEVVSTTTQFVRRKELSDEQIEAIEAWLVEQTASILS